MPCFDLSVVILLCLMEPVCHCEERAGYFTFLGFVMCTFCRGLFGVIGGSCSVTVALPGHILYYFTYY